MTASSRHSIFPPVQGPTSWPCSLTVVLASWYAPAPRQRLNTDDDDESDYQDNGSNVLLDANENAFGPSLDLTLDGKLNEVAINGHGDDKAATMDLLGLHRYPDPSAIYLSFDSCNVDTMAVIRLS